MKDDQFVEIDYIFLLRRLIEAEDNKNIILQETIYSLFSSIQEYSEENKHMPYGPKIKISDIKKAFPEYIDFCPIKIPYI